MSTPKPFVPEVFRCKVDGTVAVETLYNDQTFRLAYRGPRATRLFPAGTLVTREFLTDVMAFDFVRLDEVLSPPPEEKPTVGPREGWRGYWDSVGHKKLCPVHTDEDMIEKCTCGDPGREEET